MRTTAHILKTTVSIAALLGSIGLAVPTIAVADEIAEGKKIAFDRKKGNCLSCHQIEGGTLAGNVGPPLIAMKARFPDRAKLREQIYDPRKLNPNTFMPPFGPHAILTADEIDKVTTFIHSL